MDQWVEWDCVMIAVHMTTDQEADRAKPEPGSTFNDQFLVTCYGSQAPPPKGSMS